MVAATTVAAFYLFLVPKAWTIIGNFHLAVGNRQAALKAFDHVCSIWPRLFDADTVLFSRGVLLMSRQEHWEDRHLDAEADFRAVISSQPDHTNAIFNLGLLLSKADDAVRTSEAVPFLRRALALSEAAGEVEEDLARRRHELGAVLLQMTGQQQTGQQQTGQQQTGQQQTGQQETGQQSHAEEASALLLYPHVDATRSRFIADIADVPSSLVTQAYRLVPAAEDEKSEYTYAHMLYGVLAAVDCAGLVAVAEALAASRGGWTRGRHEAYPTTDLPLSELPQSHTAVANANIALRDAVLLALSRGYPSLAGLPLYVDDAFIAKYEEGHMYEEGHAGHQQGVLGGAQRMLNFHKDGTPLSFICTLAEPRAGGGTVFRALLPPAAAARVRAGDATAGIDYGVGNESVLVTLPGDCVVFAGGALLHGGVPVATGARFLLVGFVEVGRGANRAERRQYAAHRELWHAATKADERVGSEHRAV
jgi:hypothetical protein